MFTNKNKLIGFIALIVVIVLVASTAIALIADNAVKKAQAEADAEIAKLNETIAKLESALTGANTDLDAAETALADLKSQLASANGEIEGLETALENAIAKYEQLIKDWAEATPGVHALVTEISAKYAALVDAVNAGLLPKTVKEIEDEKMNLIYAAIRSSNLDEVRETLANNVAALEALRYDNVLQGMIDAILADGKVDDPTEAEAVADCREYFEAHKDVLVDFEDDIIALENALHADKVADLEAVFVAAVNAIVTPITLDTDLTAANTAWENLQNALRDGDVLKAETNVAKTTLDGYADRKVELAKAQAAANDILALIASKLAEVKAEGYKPTLSDKEYIAGLVADVADWKGDYNMTNDPTNTEAFGMTNPTDELEKAFAATVDTLKGLYDALVEAVNADGFKKIDLNSEDEVVAAEEALAKVNVYTDVEALLNNLANGTMADLNKLVADARATYDALVVEINNLRALIKATFDAGFRAADLDANLTAIESGLASLTSRGYDVNDIVGAEHMGYVAVIKLYPAKSAADKNVEESYNAHYNALVNDKDLPALSAQLNKLHDEIAKSTDAARLAELADRDYVDDLFDNCLTAGGNTEK